MLLKSSTAVKQTDKKVISLVIQVKTMTGWKLKLFRLYLVTILRILGASHKGSDHKEKILRLQNYVIQAKVHCTVHLTLYSLSKMQYAVSPPG